MCPKTLRYTTPPYISFHIKDTHRVELCAELFYDIVLTLFPCLAFVFPASPLSYMLLREGPCLWFDFVMKVWPKSWGDFLCGQYFWRVENAVLTSCHWLTDPCLGLVRPELAGNCPRPGFSLSYFFFCRHSAGGVGTFVSSYIRTWYVSFAMRMRE